jgi:LysM repeat protein
VGAAPAAVEPSSAPVEVSTPEPEVAPVALAIPIPEPEPVVAPIPVAMASVESEPEPVPAPAQAPAFEVYYAPQPGETLADVAERAYGREELAAWIAAENQLPPNTRPASATLRLPSASAHEVVAGETWGSLAALALGREDLAAELAALNGSLESAEPGVGEIVALPALVRVRLAAGDSLARVSRRFYGNPDQALLIARLNEIRDPSRVVPGQEVLVPVAHLVSLPSPARASE